MTCEHADVRYSKAEKGAIACHVCGRLFGHLMGETFIAYNPFATYTPQQVQSMTPETLAGVKAGKTISPLTLGEQERVAGREFAEEDAGCDA